MRLKYLILISQELIPAIDVLIEQKQSSGYEVIVKPVKDFTVGQKVLYVLMREYVLNVKPKFLLLVGDNDTVPGHFIEATGADTPVFYSDAYLSMGADDVLPQIPTGRLSTNNLSEVRKICNQLVSYPNDQDILWRLRVILAGWLPRGRDCIDMHWRDDSGWACLKEIGDRYEVIKRFENNESIEGEVNSRLGNGAKRREVWEVEGTSKKDLINAIEEGALMIRYLGHGSPSAWHNIGIKDSTLDEHFGVADVAQLSVGKRLPLLISATCHTGQITAAPAFAEAWQTTGKAIGVFAADTVSSTYWNDRVTQLIFHEIASRDKRKVGDVLTDAMRRLYDNLKAENHLGEFERRTFKMYRYLGDPDTNLAQPENEQVMRLIEGATQHGGDRFESLHHVHTRTGDDKELYTLTGTVRIDLKGKKGDWKEEIVEIGIKLPEIPHGKAFHIDHWAPS